MTIKVIGINRQAEMYVKQYCAVNKDDDNGMNHNILFKSSPRLNSSLKKEKALGRIKKIKIICISKILCTVVCSSTF